MLCFEQSTLPLHKGTRTLVMRVKKLTSPVKTVIPGYDGWVSKPQEGQLVMHRTHGRREPEPWSVDVDEVEEMAALQVLLRDGE